MAQLRGAKSLGLIKSLNEKDYPAGAEQSLKIHIYF